MIKQCPYCNLDFEASSEGQKICFSCFKLSTGQREVARDEIVIDIDSPDLNGCMCVSAVGITLFNEGYHFELWYADGQKQPHIHIKNIPHITNLSDLQLKEYKKLFLQKFIPLTFWNDKIPDYNLCNSRHLVAEEDKPHFKYKTLKLLRSEFNKDKLNYCDIELFEKAKQTNREDYKPVIQGSGITAKIIQAINIKDIAHQFGLKIHGSKCLCPFHADSKTPSLIFYEQQGRFHCFGCNEDGNIIKFYAKLKELKPEFKYRKVQQ